MTSEREEGLAPGTDRQQAYRILRLVVDQFEPSLHEVGRRENIVVGVLGRKRHEQVRGWQWKGGVCPTFAGCGANFKQGRRADSGVLERVMNQVLTCSV